MKALDFDKFLATQLRKPEFRKAYEELEDEYELAAQIIRFRTNRKLTQAQLARLVGTSQPAIARLESGNHRNLTLSFIYRVAKALDLRPELRLRELKGPRAALSVARRKASRTAASTSAKSR